VPLNIPKRKSHLPKQVAFLSVIIRRRD
jgi:hypothetical protein